MASYNPFAWSTTLTLSRDTLARRDSDGKLALTKSVTFQWIFLRFLLGADVCLLFEIMGAFVLSQADYAGRDFKTHRSARALLFIGCIGGLPVGLVLILIDVFTSGVPTLNGTGRRKMDDTDVVAHFQPRKAAIQQCLLRILLWPPLAAMGGVVGTLLWHVSERSKRGDPLARSATGALVQTVGAAIIVSGPSVVQLLLLGLGSTTKPNSKGKA